MSDVSDQASEQGRFAAREFLSRWTRETGEILSPTAIDRLLFTYEWVTSADAVTRRQKR